jgi:hypothetical protein
MSNLESDVLVIGGGMAAAWAAIGAARAGASIDCQTCYMCELYCKADASYVASDCERPETADEAQVIVSGHLGQFRRDHGWDEWAADSRYTNQHWYVGEVFRRARNPG